MSKYASTPKPGLLGIRIIEASLGISVAVICGTERRGSLLVLALYPDLAERAVGAILNLSGRRCRSMEIRCGRYGFALSEVVRVSRSLERLLLSRGLDLLLL